jgi:hypothetical protein
MTTHHHVYTAEVMNKWSDTSTPAYDFMGFTVILHACKVKVTERVCTGFFWLWVGLSGGPFETVSLLSVSISVGNFLTW